RREQEPAPGLRPAIHPRGYRQRGSVGSDALFLLLSQKATPHVRRDGAQEHGRNPSKPSPAPRGRRWTVGQVSWLPDLPTPGPSHTGNPGSQSEDPRVQWLFPVSYPVTVAGAAPVSHRLPSKPFAS